MNSRDAREPIELKYPTGREVLDNYWGFLKHGGLVLSEPDKLTGLGEGDPVALRVQIQSLKQVFEVKASLIKRSTDGRRAFVAFDESESQAMMLNAAWADSQGVPQRKHRRYPVDDQVRYTSSDGAKEGVPGFLLDVSPGGCRLRGDVVLPVGAHVRVNTLGIDLDGKVRWTTPGNEMGIEFLKPDLVVQVFLDRT